MFVPTLDPREHGIVASTQNAQQTRRGAADHADAGRYGPDNPVGTDAGLGSAAAAMTEPVSRAAAENSRQLQDSVLRMVRHGHGARERGRVSSSVRVRV